jgi:molybdate transport system substrate-binding protein
MRARRSFSSSSSSPFPGFSQSATSLSSRDLASPARPRRFSYLAVSALLLVLALGVSACGTSSGGTTSAAQPVTLTVFAASSLTAAFGKIESQFHSTHSNVTFTNNFAGSNALAGQITQGAPADVFASANNTQMNVAVTGGEIDSSQVQVFAHNRLVVIVPKNNPANIQTLQDLAKPGIKLVLADKTVPAGQYAVQFLMQASADPSFGASYQTNVLKNVVSYQPDAALVIAQIALGEADAGIVYTTDAATDPTTLELITIPDTLNVIATYSIAPVKASKSLSTAQQFIGFVTGPAILSGQSILGSYGFQPAPGGPSYTSPSS